MIREQEILDEIINIRKKIELLANPLYNDFCGSHLWGDIDKKLKEIETILIKDKNTYNW